MYKIYKLLKGDKVVYVGRTEKKYLSERAGHHKWLGKDFDSYELIELTEDPIREHYWINYYNTHKNGLNENKNGLGGGYHKTSYRKRSVKVFNDYGFEMIYESINEAGRQLSLYPSALTMVCQGKAKQTKGYKAEYIEEENNEEKEIN